ncbi:MAG: hypothetical protein LIO44_05540 [Eubacterium sp.]|nr:hypothetical protein [Eubacterium sp.]
MIKNDVKRYSGIKWRIIELLWMLKNPHKRNEYAKKLRMFAEYGDNNFICSRRLPTEPYLVKIHNNVSMAVNVRFITMTL